jgi:hypothetical protein
MTAGLNVFLLASPVLPLVSACLGGSGQEAQAEALKGESQTVVAEAAFVELSRPF